jgi:hypothetical protein
MNRHLDIYEIFLESAHICVFVIYPSIKEKKYFMFGWNMWNRTQNVWRGSFTPLSACVGFFTSGPGQYLWLKPQVGKKFTVGNFSWDIYRACTPPLPISKYWGWHVTPCCGLEVQNPTQELKSVKCPQVGRLFCNLAIPKIFVSSLFIPVSTVRNVLVKVPIYHESKLHKLET